MTIPSGPEPGVSDSKVDVQVGGQLPHRWFGARPCAVGQRSAPAGVHVIVGAVSDENRLTSRLSVVLSDGSGRIRCDTHQHRADGERLAVRPAEFDDAACERARDLHLGLVGLHGAQRLVQRDVVADRHAPTRYRRVLEALAEIGNEELPHSLRCS